jgi:hypothetical protein
VDTTGGGADVLTTGVGADVVVGGNDDGTIFLKLVFRHCDRSGRRAHSLAKR